MNRDSNLQSGYGYVVVRATTARGAIPLEGALVEIYDYGEEFTEGRGDVIGVYKTNASGLTEKIQLPAPSRSLSMSPGNGKSFSTYNIRVSKEGYAPTNYINVPVFEGITAVQSAELIPLSANGQTDGYDPRANTFFESENPALSSTKNGKESK